MLKQLNRVGGVHAAEKLVHEYKTLKGTNVAGMLYVRSAWL